MKSLLLVMAALLMVSAAEECPDKYMESIDLDKFMGKWYEYASSGTLLWPSLNSCVEYEYKKLEGVSITIDNKFIVCGIAFRSTWTAKASDPATPNGNLLLDVKLPPPLGEIPEVGHHKMKTMILGTDYSNYAVLYACKIIQSKKIESAFVYTRSRTPGLEFKQEVNKALSQVDLTLDNLTVIKQDGCDYSKGFAVNTSLVGKVISMWSNTTPLGRAANAAAYVSSFAEYKDTAASVGNVAGSTYKMLGSTFGSGDGQTGTKTTNQDGSSNGVTMENAASVGKAAAGIAGSAWSSLGTALASGAGQQPGKKTADQADPGMSVPVN